jgi:hypothetical protein
MAQGCRQCFNRLKGAALQEREICVRLGSAEERWSLGENPPLFEFQAREPSRLAASEACPESVTFTRYCGFGQFFAFEDLWILRQHFSLAYIEFPLLKERLIVVGVVFFDDDDHIVRERT